MTVQLPRATRHARNLDLENFPLWYPLPLLCSGSGNGAAMGATSTCRLARLARLLLHAFCL